MVRDMPMKPALEALGEVQSRLPQKRSFPGLLAYDLLIPDLWEARLSGRGP
jgi:hypothetical protein